MTVLDSLLDDRWSTGLMDGHAGLSGISVYACMYMLTICVKKNYLLIM